MLLAAVVATSEAVAATRSRSRKIELIAGLLREAGAGEVPIVTAMLAGEARQGRIGIGWRTLASVDVTPVAAPSLTVEAVDAILVQLQEAVGDGSQARRRELLERLFGAATAAETAFLTQLLGGEVRQGALAGIMADAIARASEVPVAAVRRAAMLAGDLAEVARVAMAGGATALDGIGLHVLRPLLPMLASTSTDVEGALAATGRASVEWKLDGIRLQVHRAGAEVRLFTRNLNDVTQRLGTVVDLVRSLPADRVVLDGEVLGTGSDDDRPEAFQSTMSRFGRHENSLDGLKVRFFDCLHLDGRDLLDDPLGARQAALEQVAGEWRIPAVVTDDVAVASEVLADALAHGHEGVVVKSIGSRYEAGRRGQAWRKVKPVHTFDLVVLGAEWGHGRRQGTLSNLHLGARDPRTGAYVMVGKTFKGLTDELLAWQTGELLARETGRDGIVVWVRPNLVVEIAIDGVQRSPRYPGGVALRFARVRRYRSDKDPADADTIDAIRALLPPGG